MEIVKLGGSLLSLPDLSARLFDAIENHRMLNPVIIVGGGTLADEVRGLQHLAGFDDYHAHWLAIDAMSVNSTQLCRLNSRLSLTVTQEESFRSLQAGKIPVLNILKVVQQEEATLEWLNQESPSQEVAGSFTSSIVSLETGLQTSLSHSRLPRSWDVTSDSIAAWICSRWSCSRLWMLKSCDTSTLEPSALARRQLVDTWFPNALPPEVRLHWVNLRNGLLFC